MKRAISWFLLLCMVVGLFPGMTVSAAAVQENWELDVQKIDVYEEMHTVIYNVSYDGTSVPEYVDRVPSTGYVFAVVTIEADKVVPGSDPLDVSAPELVIDGREYAAVADDAFLNHFGYTVFSTSGQENVFCVASAIFEIPAELKDSEGLGWYVRVGGFTSAAYIGNSTELPQALSLEAQQAAVEEDLLAQYAAREDTSLENAIVAVNPYKISPLTALLIFDTEEETSVKTTVKGQNGGLDIYTVREDTAIHHVVPVYGLYPDCDNTVEVVAGSETKTFTIHTDAIPDELDKYVGDYIRTGTSNQDENGLIFALDKYRFAIDLEGKVRWYLTLQGAASSIEETMDDGSIWLSTSATSFGSELYHLNKLGKVLNHYSFNDLNTHHDAAYIEEDNALLYFHGNTIRKLNLTNGRNTHWLNFADILDPMVGNVDIRTQNGDSDWIHQNTIEFVDGKLYMSYRNQAMLMKMDYKTQAIEWVATPSAWVNENGSKGALQPSIADVAVVPVDPDFQWFYSQHDISLLPDQDGDPNTEDFTLFDNGCFRGDPNTKHRDMYSRVMQYRVDTVAGTIEEVYSFGDPVHNKYYSSVGGSTQYLGDGSYLSSFGSSASGPKVVLIESSTGLDAKWQRATGSVYRCYYVNAQEFADDQIVLGNGPVVQLDSFGWNEIETLPDTDAGVHHELKELSVSETDVLTIEGWAVIEGRTNYVTHTYLVMNGRKSGKHIAQRMQYNCYETVIPAEFQEADTVYMGGFRSVGIDLSELPEDLYTVGMLVVAGPHSRYVDLGYTYTNGVVYENAANTDILKVQAAIDEELLATTNGGGYTLNNPYTVVDPYGISPLSAYVIFDTEQPASVSVTVKSKAGAADVTADLTTVGTKHVVPVYGLYSEEATDVVLTVHNADGTSASNTIQLTGGVIPPTSPELPMFTSTVYNVSAMVPGWTTYIPAGPNWYLLSVDENGDIRSYFTRAGIGCTAPILPLENGHFLVSGAQSANNSMYRSNLFEMDLTGKVYKDYLCDNNHHDFLELPNGNFLICVNNFQTGVVEDTVLEMDRNTGAIVRVWDMNSYFNVSNFAEDGTHIADENYVLDGFTTDWFHNNSIDYRVDERGQEHMVLSARHQDAIISINLTTGELEWILSDPSEGASAWNTELASKLLTPVGDNFEYQYGQHSIRYLPNGDIFLFDNGNFRTKDPAEVKPAPEAGYSRMAVYHVDAVNKTIEQTFQFGKEFGSANLAPYISNVQYLGENHYLVNFGGIAMTASGEASYSNKVIFTGSSRTRCYEILNGEIVMMQERSGLKGSANAYRAYRIDPYVSLTESDLTVRGERIGALVDQGKAVAAALPAGSALAVENVSVSDDGVYLNISATIDSSEAAKVYFVSNEKSLAVPAENNGGALSLKLSDNEIPAGTYKLYVVAGTSVGNLGVKWNNVANAAQSPTVYTVTVSSANAEMGEAFGGGYYYANTALTITAIAKEGYEFVNWTVGGNVVDTRDILSFCPVGDVDLVANFKVAGAEEPPSDGSGSGGSSSSGGSGASSSTDTKVNEDGSVTKTTTDKKTGTVTAVTTAKDGTVTTVVTQKDGTVTETKALASGVAATTVKDSTGAITSIEAEVPTSVAGDKNTVVLPVEVPAASSSEAALTVKIKVPTSETGVKVAIPTLNATTGTVAVIVKDDGTEEVVKTSIVTENGVQLLLKGNAAVKLVDRSRSFNDIKGENWYNDSVNFVSARGLMNGSPDNRFSPNEKLNRGMMVTVLWSLDDAPDAVEGNSFSDVKDSDWFATPVKWAVKNGVSAGYGNSFGANDSITRQQMAVMLYAYATNKGYNTTITEDLSRFNDGDSTADWAATAMAWAVSHGLIGGKDGNRLDPTGAATRAEVATILRNFCTVVAE